MGWFISHLYMINEPVYKINPFYRNIWEMGWQFSLSTFGAEGRPRGKSWLHPHTSLIKKNFNGLIYVLQQPPKWHIYLPGAVRPFCCCGMYPKHSIISNIDPLFPVVSFPVFFVVLAWLLDILQKKYH